MFVDACAKSVKYTKPLITSLAMVDGTVTSGVASFVMVNREGWAITAAHCVSAFMQQRECHEKMRQVDAWNNEHPDSKKEYDPKWLRAHSFWWGHDNIRMGEVHYMGDIDLAIVKLLNVPDGFVTEYPTFKSPDGIKMGMSVCRIGFPFVTIKTEFEPEMNRFRLDNPPHVISQYFPNDGIITRNVVKAIVTPDGKISQLGASGIQPLYVETSTPGLKGQSGGPIFDTQGNIVAIQSVTVPINLGFGIIKDANGNTLPEEYMYVGNGVHVRTVIQALEKVGVKYKFESDDYGYRIVG